WMPPATACWGSNLSVISSCDGRVTAVSKAFQHCPKWRVCWLECWCGEGFWGEPCCTQHTISSPTRSGKLFYGNCRVQLGQELSKGLHVELNCLAAWSVRPGTRPEHGK